MTHLDVLCLPTFREKAFSRQLGLRIGALVKCSTWSGIALLPKTRPSRGLDVRQAGRILCIFHRNVEEDVSHVTCPSPGPER